MARKARFGIEFGEWAGFGISLEQRGVDNFTVRYGEQRDEDLTYSAAAAKLGQAFMHALACEGRIDGPGYRSGGDDEARRRDAAIAEHRRLHTNKEVGT